MNYLVEILRRFAVFNDLYKTLFVAERTMKWDTSRLL
jgi:hypothetical protein